MSAARLCLPTATARGAHCDTVLTVLLRKMAMQHLAAGLVSATTAGAPCARQLSALSLTQLAQTWTSIRSQYALQQQQQQRNAATSATLPNGLPAHVTIYEVGPRDGLQNEPKAGLVARKVSDTHSPLEGGAGLREGRTSSTQGRGSRWHVLYFESLAQPCTSSRRPHDQLHAVGQSRCHGCYILRSFPLRSLPPSDPAVTS